MNEHFHTLKVTVDDKKPDAVWIGRQPLMTEYVDEKTARQRAERWMQLAKEDAFAAVAVVKHRNGSIVAVYTSQ